MTSSWLVVVAAVVVVWPAICFCPAVSSCESDAPDNCSFANGFCSWDKPGDKWARRNNFAYLKPDKLSGNIRSRLACATNSLSHCLRFRYYLANNTKYTISVHIRRSNTELQLWNTSTLTRWGNATVSVTSNSDFQLIIKGTRTSKDGERTRKVRVDDIMYTRSPCDASVSTTTTHPTLRESTTTNPPSPTSKTTHDEHNESGGGESSPDDSAVSSVTTPPSTSTSDIAKTTTTTASSPVTPSPTTSASATTPSPPDGSHSQVNTRPTTPDSPGSTTPRVLTSTADPSPLGGADHPSSDVATVVGVVVAVVVVIVVVVVVVVVVRRRGVLCWKSRAEDKSTTHLHDTDLHGTDRHCDNAAYDVTGDVTETHYMTIVGDSHVTSPSHVTPPSHVTSPSHVTPPSQSPRDSTQRWSQLSASPDLYSVIPDVDHAPRDSAFQHRTSLYSLARLTPSSPRDLDRDLDPDLPDGYPCPADPYEICGSDANSLGQQASSEKDDYKRLCFRKDGTAGSSPVALPAPNSDCVSTYDHLPSADKPGQREDCTDTTRDDNYDHLRSSDKPGQRQDCTDTTRDDNYDHLRSADKLGQREDCTDTTRDDNYDHLRSSDKPGRSVDYKDTARDERSDLEEDLATPEPPPQEGGLYHILEESAGMDPFDETTGLYHLAGEGIQGKPSGSQGNPTGIYHNIGKSTQGRPTELKHVAGEDTRGGFTNVHAAHPARTPRENLTAIYHNLGENTQGTSPGTYHVLEEDTPDSPTGMYHILEEDTQGSSTDTYHVLGKGTQAGSGPRGKPADTYHVLGEDTQDRHPDVHHVLEEDIPDRPTGTRYEEDIPDRAPDLQHAPEGGGREEQGGGSHHVREGSGGEHRWPSDHAHPHASLYSSLHFHGRGNGEGEREGGEGDALYSHLNEGVEDEGVEDIYSQVTVTGNRRREVIDDVYSHLSPV